MSEELEFTVFTRRPFVVEAIQITEDNIEELAGLIGEVRHKDDEIYISIDRRVIPNIRKAYVGWWVTRMDDNLRCYSPKIFEEQFEEDVDIDLHDPDQHEKEFVFEGLPEGEYDQDV